MNVNAETRRKIKRALNPTEAIVLYTLLDNTDDEMSCNIRLKVLMSQTMLCKQAIQRNIGRMRDKGLIEVIPQFRDDGGKAPNIYKIILEDKTLDRLEQERKAQLKGAGSVKL